MSTSTARTPPSTMSQGLIVITLTLLVGMQPLTTDVFLPAMSTLPGAFNTSVATAQLTLSALIISFGFAQLIMGQLSDRFGRRPVLIGGLGLYSIASVLGALAPSMSLVIVARSLQGVGVAATVVCGRAMIRDLFEPHEGVRVMSKALSGLGLVAIPAPVIGGLLVLWFDWRYTMGFLALASAAVLIFVCTRVNETLAVKNYNATQIEPLMNNWRVIAQHPTFLSYTALASFAYTGFFTFMAGASFVFVRLLGTSRLTLGIIFASVSAVYILGTMLCRRLLSRVGLRRTVYFGGWLSFIGAISVITLSLTGWHSFWAILLPQYLLMLGNGIHQPCGQAGSVGPFPEKAGAASALSGFIVMVSAFSMGMWLGQNLNDTATPLAFAMGFCGIAIALIAWIAVQRWGEPARH